MSLRPLGHPQTTRYARSGIFKGLTDFAELERRIERLPTEQERGDVLEVFAEAYLDADAVAQADEVWVAGRIPRGVLKELNLPSRDFGADGVYRSRLGDLVPYQVKFHTGRPALPYRELATFFGITNQTAVFRVQQERHPPSPRCAQGPHRKGSGASGFLLYFLKGDKGLAGGARSGWKISGFSQTISASR